MPSTSPPTTADPDTPATMPAEVEAGRAYLVLDGELGVLSVTACALDPVPDPATGVTTVLSASAEDGTGRTVEVRRSRVELGVPTTTDTVTVTDAEGTVEASRADLGGRQIDLRLDNPVGALLELDEETGTIAAIGVFGPAGSLLGEPGLLDGELLLRCP